MENAFTIEEKDRLMEIMFYYFFEGQDRKVIKNPAFWNTINSLCSSFEVDSLSVSKSIRFLMSEENQPQDHESQYLFTKMGLSVRQIYTITGLYWQKQKEISGDIDTGTFVVTRKINDIVMKRSIRDFIFAVYKFFGYFVKIKEKEFEKLFK